MVSWIDGLTGPPAGEDPSPAERLIFCLVLSFSALIIEGYNYSLAGTDQIQQLPLILRALDPAFLENDFFINSSMVYGPRYFYIAGMGQLAGIIPLPVLMLALTWLCYLAIAWITYGAARSIFSGDTLAAMLACALVFGVEGLMIGENGHLLEPYLIPRMAARPLILLGFWLGLTGRPLICAPIIALAALIHPLESVGAGLMGLGAQGLVLLIRVIRDRNRRADLILLLKTGAAALFLAAFIFVVFLSRQDTSLDDATFIHYWAVFRHPHHYIPSTWPWFHYLAGAGFALALGLSCRWAVQDKRIEPETAAKTLWVTTATAGLCLGGYVFVELLPTRLWTMMQAYRFLFVIKWLGLMIMAGTAAAILKTEARPWIEKLPAPIILAGSYLNQSLMLLWGHLLEVLKRNTRRPISLPPLLLWWALGLVGAAVLMNLLGFRYREMFKVCIFTCMAMWFLILPRSWLRSALPLAGGVALVVLAFWGPVPGLTLKWTGPAVAHLGPPDEMSHFASRPADFAPPPRLSGWVRENTGDDGLFIVPPMFGLFRLTAGRAVVVDFKCIPYTDSSILEWARRLKDCYGPPEGNGFAAVARMEENYKRITDDQLRRLAQKYKATHAVLFGETETGLPVLYQGRYKVVRID